MNAAERMLTITEAARLTGLSRKALARRIERGTLRALLSPDQLRRLPVEELVRAGLLDEQGNPGLPVATGSSRRLAGQGGSGAAPGRWGGAPGYPGPGPGPAGSPTRRVPSPLDASALLSRLERLAAENERLRALQSRYSELERDLAAEREMRARIEAELVTLWAETESRKRPWGRRRTPAA